MHASAILISDLHLTPSMPRTATRFFEFLEKEARAYETLIILGDLFEFWVGDDAKARSPFHQEVALAIKAVSQAGTKVYFMPGNRDFLLGQQYAQKSQMIILRDPQVMVISDHAWLLTHGDALCTADSNYQMFRKVVRCPLVQKLFLLLPTFLRVQIASSLRSKSTAKYQRTQKFTPEINKVKGDVTLSATAALIDSLDCQKMIHGHTHRPGYHQETLGGRSWERWVLSDWDFDHPETVLPKGNALSITSEGIRSLDLVRA
jgi:UDP-2,3-diacylglucosamine hydrolase